MRHNTQGKPRTYLETPEDFALFKVMRNCLMETVTNRVGYEAELANVSFKIESVEEMAVKVTFEGYSDKLVDFA